MFSMILRKTVNLFLQLGLICSPTIRLQYSLIINFSGMNQSVSQIFCIAVILEERYYLRLPLSIGCGQLCLLSNQTAKFFDHQYLGKESSDASIFVWSKVEGSICDYWLLVGCHQLLLSSNPIAEFFNPQNLRKESIDILVFLHGDSHQEKLPLLVKCGQVCL